MAVHSGSPRLEAIATPKLYHFSESLIALSLASEWHRSIHIESNDWQEAKDR
jgi:hypothetical protein